MRQFFGKYRGKVESNADPLQLGRLRVSVPGVLDDGRMSWAMPCVPYAGKGVGLLALPPSGANVWVEFEAGNPECPIWSGCFWGAGEMPMRPAAAHAKVLKTDQVTMTFDDRPDSGGITIETTTGIRLSIRPSGIEIDNGQGAAIKLTGPSVSVNEGALEVT
jgi:uncharacterized protein involved in type VI secretion and phage assembly